MGRYILVTLLVGFAAPALAQPSLENRLRKELSDVQMLTNELVKEAQRDAEILRLLLEANRALDDWQKNNALTDALERISKAEQLRSPNRKVQQAVRVAKEIIEPAAESPTTADLQKLRDQLNSRSIFWMREVVTEEMHGLAISTTMLSDAATLLSKALAGASAAVVGRPE